MLRTTLLFVSIIQCAAMDKLSAPLFHKPRGTGTDETYEMVTSHPCDSGGSSCKDCFSRVFFLKKDSPPSCWFNSETKDCSSIPTGGKGKWFPSSPFYGEPQKAEDPPRKFKWVLQNSGWVDETVEFKTCKAGQKSAKHCFFWCELHQSRDLDRARTRTLTFDVPSFFFKLTLCVFVA